MKPTMGRAIISVKFLTPPEEAPGEAVVIGAVDDGRTVVLKILSGSIANELPDGVL